MKYPFNRTVRWLLFVASIILMGVWFLASPFRKDERGWFADSFGLETRRVPEQGEDSVFYAWLALKRSPSLHNLRNIAHEWTKENPKRSTKFLSFLVVALAVTLALK
jgi:hypothetical protein